MLSFVLATYWLSDDGDASDDVANAAANALGAEVARADDSPADLVTINVTVDDDGVVNDAIYIPAGQPVKLIFRNRSSEEHHYHVVGMSTSELLWMAPAGHADAEEHADHEGHEGHEAQAEMPDMSEDEHAQHQSSVAFVDHHVCNSESGTCPVGDWVHAHANAGQQDVIIFTADETGTYEVVCPLHEEIQARVVVF